MNLHKKIRFFRLRTINYEFAFSMIMNFLNNL